MGKITQQASFASREGRLLFTDSEGCVICFNIYIYRIYIYRLVRSIQW
jgi:hypothetical protein